MTSVDYTEEKNYLENGKSNDLFKAFLKLYDW